MNYMTDGNNAVKSNGVEDDPAGDVLSAGRTYLEDLYHYVLETAELYRRGEEVRGGEHFVELVQGLEWFAKTAAAVETHLHVEFAATRFMGQTLPEALNTFNRILLDMVGAQEHRDWVFLSDLLEYELAPQLEQWQKIFGMLREERVAGMRSRC